MMNKFALYNYFNPCNVRPSNARIVIIFSFTVADAAGAATLRFKRSGFVHFLPPVGNAHRAFRGGRHAQLPFGRSTGKHKIANNILHGSPSRYRCTASPGIAARPNSPFISLKYFLSTFAIVSAVVLKRQLSSGTPGIFMRASLPKPHIS